jgi:signal transduction histidine kinase
VADSGPGIPPERRSRIFEPFFTTKGERGVGLGLWVTQNIVQRMGGSIHVKSRHHKQHSGTCFSIFLPDQTAASAPVKKVKEQKSSI